MHWYETELYRIKGNLLLMSSTENQSEAGEACWRTIEVARAQSAQSVELLASMSLALLWRQMGKSEQAIELLQPVYDWFTAGSGHQRPDTG